MLDGFNILGYAPDMELIIEWAWKIGAALIIWIIVGLLARGAKWAFAKLVDKLPILQHTSGSGESIGISLGTILALFIKLFGLIIILSIFGLESAVKPIEGMLNNVLSALPSLIYAGLIFYIGSIFAKIARELLVTFLSTVNFDKLASKGGVEEVTGNSQISGILGSIAYALIMIVVAIAAFDQLGIEAISGPAISILTTISNAIPQILLAVFILGIFYVVARFVSTLIADVLPGLGLDKSVATLNALPNGMTASGLLAKLSTTAIMIFGAIAATNALEFEALTNILNVVLAQGGKILFGAVVIGIGFFIANLLANLAEGSASKLIRYATLFVFVAMGLSYMDIGAEFTTYAPLAIVVGLTFAATLAFGLGGRDAAAKLLADIQDDKPVAKKPAVKKPVVKK